MSLAVLVATRLIRDGLEHGFDNLKHVSDKEWETIVSLDASFEDAGGQYFAMYWMAKNAKGGLSATKAHEYLVKSAEQGCLNAQLILAEKEKEPAWIATSDDPKALHMLAKMYEEQKLVALAKQRYENAVAKHYLPAVFDYAVMLDAEGTVETQKKALQLFFMCAEKSKQDEQKCPCPYNYLATYHRDGKGGAQKSISQAVLYLAMGAAQDEPECITRLSAIFRFRSKWWF